MSASRKVLLVDDDPDIGLALSDYLKEEGLEVDLASTAKAALQKNASNFYDVVLLDVDLPDRDGLDLLSDLSAQYPHLPVVLLTAFTALQKTNDPGIMKKAFAYLTKPYNRLEIKDTIQRAFLAHDVALVSSPRNSHNQPEGEPSQMDTQTPSFLSTPSALKPESSTLSLRDYECLARNFHMIQFAVDHVSEAVFVAGPDKRFLFVNQGASNILGYDKEELLMLRIPDIAPNHDNAVFQQRLESLRHGDSLNYSICLCHKNGQKFSVEILLYLMKWQGLEYTCAVIKEPLDSS